MARSNLGADRKGMTGIHVNLANMISGLGFHIENEYPFPPYQVDVYVPEAHVAFEADGQGHTKSRDEKRDSILLEQYGLLVRRFDGRLLETKELTSQLEDEVIDFIDEHAITARERKP